MTRGRPQKQGIDFSGWAVDIFDNEPKIDKLIDAQGCQGFVIYFYLCQRAYGSNGYFFKWSCDDAPTTARKIGGGVGSQAVIDTVRLCCRVGLFDNDLYEGHQILTSRGIQKRYRHVAITRKTPQYVISDYWLLEDHESTGLNFHALKGDLSGDKSNFDPSKINNDPSEVNYAPVKESKVKGKESKEIHPVTADAATPKKSGKAPKIFEKNSVEYKSSVYLIKKILERDPGARVPQSEEDIQKWCIHIDRILRLDKRPPEQLRTVLVFAATDPFWSANIQSTKGLREKFGTLFAHMQRPKGESRGDNRNDNANKSYDGDIFEE